MVSGLWTLVVLLILMWAIGFFVANLGGMIHILLVLALAGIVYNIIIGRRAV